MRKLAIVVSVAAVLAVTGVVRGQGKTDPALNKLSAEFAAAYNAKDAAKAASLYADDAVAMPRAATWQCGVVTLKASGAAPAAPKRLPLLGVGQ